MLRNKRASMFLRTSKISCWLCEAARDFGTGTSNFYHGFAIKKCEPKVIRSDNTRPPVETAEAPRLEKNRISIPPNRPICTAAFLIVSTRLRTDDFCRPEFTHTLLGIHLRCFLKTTNNHKSTIRHCMVHFLQKINFQQGTKVKIYMSK